MAITNMDYPELFLIIPLIIYLFYSINRRGKTPYEPTNWPLVGMLPGVIQNLHRAHDYATDVLTTCGGTYEFKGPWFSNTDMLFTCDPANIHHIFSKNFSNYPKGPEFRKIFDILGDGIFNADFELWEIHRRISLSHFTHSGFYGSLEKTVWEKVQTGLFPILDYLSEKGIEVDLQEIFQRFTFDTTCRVVLEYDPCSLRVELPYVACEKGFSDAVEPLLHRHIIPERIWKLQKWMRIGPEKKLAEASVAFDEFIIPQVIDKKNDGSKLMEAFEKAYEEKKIRSRSGKKHFLRDTALNLMFAGRDTTSTCLTWLFWLIAINPSSETKILEEIESILKKDDSQDHDKMRFFFTAEDSHKLIYLHGALCESLRLFPPVALEHKSPVGTDILPSGHYLCKSAKVIISFYSVGRMESVWGKDCLEFKPERWISVKGGIKHEPSYKFPAFNAGPRTCLGKEMAFVQMKMVVAAVIYHYRVELVEGHPVCPNDSIILYAKHGIKVKLSKRSRV